MVLTSKSSKPLNQDCTNGTVRYVAKPDASCFMGSELEGTEPEFFVFFFKKLKNYESSH